MYIKGKTYIFCFYIRTLVEVYHHDLELCFLLDCVRVAQTLLVCWLFFKHINVLPSIYQDELISFLCTYMSICICIYTQNIFYNTKSYREGRIAFRSLFLFGRCFFFFCYLLSGVKVSYCFRIFFFTFPCLLLVLSVTQHINIRL